MALRKRNRAAEAERMRRWRKQNPEKYRAAKLRYAKRHRRKMLAYYRKYNRAHRAQRTQNDKNRRLVKLYGLTLGQFEGLLSKQGGRCKICRRRPRKYNLNVDHCHKTGRIRGLLCAPCNGHVGWFERFHKQAAKYLK